MIFRPEAFEPLTELSWDERRVRDGIREIVADTDGACDPERLWPAHEWDAWMTPQPLQNLYVGEHRAVVKRELGGGAMAERDVSQLPWSGSHPGAR